ncbi:MAG: hypothetical protein ACLFQL_03675 [Paracoccaceae bacterium]
MKYRLQGYVAAFGRCAANAFDLDAWRQATVLRYFGVRLELKSGSMRVALTHIAPDGTATRLHVLDCPGPGAAFTPPLYLPELAGVLLPEIEAQSDDAAYDLHVGTDDPPATPWLRVGYIRDAAGDGTAGCAECFGHYLRIYGDHDHAHLALIGGGADIATGGGEEADTHVSHLPDDATHLARGAGANPEAEAFGRGLHEACYGRLAGRNFTHLCLIGDGLRLDPELFARTTAMLRFLRPGVQLAAPLYQPAAEDPRRPGIVVRFGWQAGDRLDAGDTALQGTAEHGNVATLLTQPRNPDIHLPFWTALPLNGIHQAGLPSRLMGGEAVAEHALRLRAAGMRLVVPLSLWALRDTETTAMAGPRPLHLRLRARMLRLGRIRQAAPGWVEPETDRRPPRQRLRERMMRLALTGRIQTAAALGDRIEPPVRTALAAGEFQRAADLVGAAEDLLSGGTPQDGAAPPPGAGTERAHLAQRLEELLARIVHDWPARLADLRDARDRSATIGHWAHADHIAETATDLAGLRRGLTELQQELAAAYAKMEALRDELHRARHADSERIATLLRRNRLEDTPQVLGDLDRGSLAALHLLRNRHAGRRAVIIGNGPSLRIGDLERLRDEVTFASNKIYLAFDETSWRPVYYSVEDSLVMQQNRDRIAALQGMTKIFPENMRIMGYHEADAILVPFLPAASFEDPLSDPAFPGFSEDLCQGICWGSTIVYSQIQMALHMGCTEIILIGVDHDYRLPTTRKGRFYVHEGERNHFHPAYRDPGETWHAPNLDVLEVSFARARDHCAARGVRVRNASRHTRLEVFERADFDNLFPHRSIPAKGEGDADPSL